MVKRLISLREFGELEGLALRHRGLLERLEQLEWDAAAFNALARGLLEPSRRADAVRRELTELLGRLLQRVQGSR